MRRYLFDILKVVISLGLILFLLTQVNLAQVGGIIARANLWLLALALLLYIGAMAANGLKWYVLLRAQGIQAALADVLVYTFVGFFFNNFLPANVGGDVARFATLARDTEQRAESALSVIMDRLVGLFTYITVAAVMGGVMVFVVGRTDLANLAAMAGLLFLLAALGFAVLLSRRLRRLVERLFGLPVLDRLAPLYRRLSSAVQMYRDRPAVLVLAFGISFGGLVLTNLVNLLVALALGIDLPLVYIFFFNPLLAFAPLIVPSLGGLGVTQGFYDLFYNGLGHLITSDESLSISLTLQAIFYLSSLPGGMLWWRGRSKSD
ncbi:MAG: flippase-like domain-containing protein [Chloroflexi bacterium]|nr:flippase-like domain-containing protein [Chloroflexota bacterium]MBU1751606.1 flippase-like domain-containing protein [Chloroflexota bacterium]